MAIASAVQRGKMVFIYNERGQCIGSMGACQSKPGDGLTGFTGSTVAVKCGNMIKIYDEHGRQISSHGV
jgi:hypothetical protein